MDVQFLQELLQYVTSDATISTSRRLDVFGPFSIDRRKLKIVTFW
jgi:hypothetical protein